MSDEDSWGGIADQYEELDENEQSDESDRQDEKDTRDKSDESGDRYVSVENVKSAYSARAFYLNEDLRESLDDEYNRLQYEADIEFGKDRHYYPAVVLAGLQQLEQMEGDEFKELLERLE